MTMVPPAPRAEPVFNVKPPLEPVVELPVRMCIDPLVTPLPVANDTLPPATDSLPRPPSILICPPFPLSDVPPTKLTEPPFPTDAAPAAIMTLPELSCADPVTKFVLPLEPRTDAPVKISTDPL